ncbi:MAG: DUF4842 domain-containing protein [Muribaculaceae bacterium]|nr:DUF4842 domain-containing protein [Muribaculaceae bacterium]
MKKTLSLIMMLWAIILASCSADEPQAISATEDYNREFVKEFGVPAAGHDFSMATTAGLKVSTLKGDHITVTAEIDGEEYLFADCHVPAGTTAIPVTIPRTIKELKLATPRGERVVATNALVNLDEIETAVVRRAANVNPQTNPLLFFRQQDFLDNFFKKITPIQRNFTIYTLVNSFKGYIYPVYWRTNKNGFNDYQVKFLSSWFGKNEDVVSKDVIFPVTTDASTPFPDLRTTHFTTIEDVKSQGSISSCTPIPSNYIGEDFIMTRGIRIEDYVDESMFSCMATPWYLEIQYDDNRQTISQSPYRNIALWDGNYFDVPLSALNNAYLSTCMYRIGKQDLYMIDHKLTQGEPLGSGFRKVQFSNVYLIGFSAAPPTEPASGDIRDYCDVVFLYVDTGTTSGASSGTTPSYEWTIAAEDLGATDDWDFNDAVFTFSDIIRDLNTQNYESSMYNVDKWGPRDAEPVRVITVTPKASGGTMPLYITYTGKIQKVPVIPDGNGDTADIMYSTANNSLKQFNAAFNNISEGTYIVGKEIHSWLEAESYKIMVNTGETNLKLKPEPVEFAIPVDTQLGVGYDAASGTFDDNTLMASAANKTLCGFAVLVDRQNSLNIDAMNDSERGMHRADNLVMGQGMYVIGRPDASNGEIAPQMILVNNSYWKWPQERVKISDAYPDFATWLANPASATDWTRNYVKDKVTY